MRLRLLSLLLFTKVCHLNTLKGDECPQPSPPNFATFPSGKRGENSTLRYLCVDGYVRKAGTSSLVKCKRDDKGGLQWTSSNLKCIPDPKIQNPGTPSTTHQTPTMYGLLSTSVRSKSTSLGPLEYQTESSVTVDQTVTTVRMTTTIDDITSAPVDMSTILTTIPLATVSDQIQTSTDSPSVGVGTERSAIDIYSGVGSVVVIIILFALIILLLLWRRRRKRCQHLDPLPTTEEQLAMNGYETQP
ncbi:interleukin-15 receptor subunit alpha isoform X2 [Esox lucius]|uniref:interleukin-15 receptor subunit alpha isoform X2 n=1 Tax=Esox lucius TaxID=8010 RepID=UPI001476A62E|nr:interleukin-15 receptor subunit alpha isoform X2 [Esox lucius]